jgi:hypothetical protein
VTLVVPCWIWSVGLPETVKLTGMVIAVEPDGVIVMLPW